jgi:negative regulator of flagellin synthesis FlgM
MMIDRINSVNSLLVGNNANVNNQVNRPMLTDSIKVSSEALEKSELYQANALVNAAPDVRMDLIAEIKQQINDPSFINDEVLGVTADKILASFGF